MNTMLPQVEGLSTQRLNRIFDNTSATYKFYWFLAILDSFVIKGHHRMDIWDLMVEMVAKAWYPVNYFRLSFGKSESLYQAILNVQKLYNIPINQSVEDVEKVLSDLLRQSEFRKLIHFLQLNVPFRFLSPWISTSDNKLLEKRSMDYENGCLYRLERVEGSLWIELNPLWYDYLRANYCILRDFTYWNLTLFLQVRNPNVPNIPNKLMRSEVRNSLTKQRDFWNTVIRGGLDVHCIYTGKKLDVGNYDLDHFIPWSFVSHDLLWNLMPADSSINSSKNDKLPSLEDYLPKLATAHQKALKIYLTTGKNKKILEDYLSLGCTPNELIEMDKEHLVDCFRQTFTPLTQIALNMGFESWNYMK